MASNNMKRYSTTLVVIKMQITTVDDFRHPPHCLKLKMSDTQCRSECETAGVSHTEV